VIGFWKTYFVIFQSHFRQRPPLCWGCLRHGQSNMLGVYRPEKPN